VRPQKPMLLNRQDTSVYEVYDEDTFVALSDGGVVVSLPGSALDGKRRAGLFHCSPCVVVAVAAAAVVLVLAALADRHEARPSLSRAVGDGRQWASPRVARRRGAVVGHPVSGRAIRSDERDVSVPRWPVRRALGPRRRGSVRVSSPRRLPSEPQSATTGLATRPLAPTRTRPSGAAPAREFGFEG
jgi:hypothetical protein